ncbi:MAG: hypothetical protein ACRDQZ_19860 [Mycobacteriales bacterium]
MSRHAATRNPLHVLYVGSSADLGALRRLMEAHGAITRSRLTPELTVVVVDSSVPAYHPAVREAGALGIPVMEPAEAIVEFAQWRNRTEAGSPAPPEVTPAPAAERSRTWRGKAIRPAGGRRCWPFRRSTP